MDHPSNDFSWVLVFECIHDVFRVKEFRVIGGGDAKYKHPTSPDLLVWVFHGDPCKYEASHFCSLNVCSTECRRECDRLSGVAYGLYGPFYRT